MPRQNTKFRNVSRRPTEELQLDFFRTTNATREEMEEWKLDGTIYAAMLHRLDCPPAFRKALLEIFTEHLFNECELDYPPLFEILFPLVVTHLQSFIPADANRTVSILRTLRDTLAPGLYQQIQEQLEGEGLAVNYE